MVYKTFEKPIYLANLFQNGGVVQRNLRKSCKYEHCLDLGVLLPCKAPNGEPCVQLDREENYADPDQARRMSVTIYQAELYEENDAHKSVFQIEAEKERMAYGNSSMEFTQDREYQDLRMVLQLTF